MKQEALHFMNIIKVVTSYPMMLKPLRLKESQHGRVIVRSVKSGALLNGVKNMVEIQYVQKLFPTHTIIVATKHYL